jgi:hypothetical protein
MAAAVVESNLFRQLGTQTGDWATVSYTDSVRDERTLKHYFRGGYVPSTPAIRDGVEAFLRKCEAKGFRIHPGYQGVPHNQGGGWIVTYNIDMRNTRLV